MTIFDKLEAEKTGRSFPVHQSSLLAYKEGVAPQHGECYSEIEEYEYGFSAKLLFNCTKDKFNLSVEKARKIVINELYGDVISSLYKIGYLVDNCNNDRASEMIRSLINDLRGEGASGN